MKPRTAATVIATTALALLAAACGGSPSSTGSSIGPGGATNAAGPVRSQSANSQVLAFSRCVRSHGVPNFPDPNSSGELPKRQLQRLAAGNPRYPAATNACQHLLPNGGSWRSQATVQQWWSGMREFAHCMRSHGVPNWPDPTRYPGHPEDPTFDLPASIHPTSQVVSKMRECQRLVPHNYVGGHINNDSWQSVSREMGGS